MDVLTLGQIDSMLLCATDKLKELQPHHKDARPSESARINAQSQRIMVAMRTLMNALLRCYHQPTYDVLVQVVAPDTAIGDEGIRLLYSTLKKTIEDIDVPPVA